jgi:hypothetical protein
MGADFTFQIIPYCELTPERLEQAKAIITNSTDLVDEFVKIKALDVLDQYCDGEYEDSREVSHMHLNDKVYYITGGMSSGDSPTEAYDDFSLIQECFEQFEKWGVEDKAKEAPHASV